MYFINIKLCGASADVHANVDYYFAILTELLYYILSMTSSFVNTCITHTSFTVFDNVVYSVKPMLGPGFIFVIISRSPDRPTSANSTNAILSQ